MPNESALITCLKWCGGGLFGAARFGASTLFNEHLAPLVLLVGGLAGLGVSRMSRGNESHILPALIALIAALLVGLAAKYFTVAMLWIPENREFWDFASAASVDEDAMISLMSDDVVSERQARGESIDWPSPDMTLKDATWQEDYPVEIWEEGRRRWQSLSAADQEARREARAAAVADVVRGYQTPEFRAAFLRSFGSWDLLWFGAALAAAFAVGGRYVLAG